MLIVLFDCLVSSVVSKQLLGSAIFQLKNINSLDKRDSTVLLYCTNLNISFYILFSCNLLLIVFS